MRKTRSGLHKKSKLKRLKKLGMETGRKTIHPILIIILFVLTALFIPVILVVRQEPMPLPAEEASLQPEIPQSTKQTLPPSSGESSEQAVSVYLTATGEVETLPLEDYLVGVVAAEMPAEFELEALKAQAIAARTFIVRRLQLGDRSGVPEEEADVTDAVSHQAYHSRTILEKDWSLPEYKDKLNRIKQAVLETRGIIMTYNGQPINASFFSTSNGYTENSEEVWSNQVAYLRSVPSPWDVKLAPEYKQTVSYSREEFLSMLGIVSRKPNKTSTAAQPSIQVKSLSTGHRIKEVVIEGKSFSGREVREKLNLRSSQFSWKWNGDRIEITTYGYGHGVGMSQWGANGMALEGHKAKEILRHYYTGISFDQASRMLSKK